MSSKVSVVIPTRERHDTLEHALRTVTSQTHENLEIIVSDNASSPATRAVVEAANDSRVRYLNTGRRVSMTENFEFALGHITGDWIAVIGDDDGILPSGIERALKAVAATGANALSSNSAHYRWPAPSDQGGPEMYLTMPAERGWKIRDARAHLLDVLDARLNYTQSPMFYTGGFVRSDLYHAIKEKSGGKFFRSQIPDVYSALAICSTIKSFVHLREPIAIAGHSQHSNGMNPTGKPGALFVKENTIPLHDELVLPPGGNVYPILSALIYETFLQSAFLREGDKIEVDMERQFQLIKDAARPQLGQSADWDSFFENWSARFAEHHKVGSSPGLRAAAKRQARGAIARARHRASSLFRYYRFDRAMGFPYANVYDAACTAEQYLHGRHSIAQNLLHSVRRKVRKRG